MITESANDPISVRLPPNLRNAINAAAMARGMSVSGWLRQAAMTCAMLEGVLVGQAPDVRPDGKRRYARIEGGAIVDVIYSDGEVA